MLDMDYTLSHLKSLCANYSVLYAEDDKETQLEMEKILKRIFHEVYIVDDGEVGKEAFDTFKPTLVITDIQMPNQNGLDLTAYVKSISPNTPVIITTAFNEEHYFLKAIEVGVDSFLLKPIDKEKLYMAIAKHIQQVDYERKARELASLQYMQNINQASEDSVQNLANLLPFPALLYKNNDLYFINQKTIESIHLDELQSVQSESHFTQRFSLRHDKRQKIKLMTLNGLNKIYWVYPHSLKLATFEASIHIYLFVDITMVEYQKLKLSTYMVFLNEASTLKQSDAIKVTQSVSDKIVSNNTCVKSERIDILRKSHTYRIDAKSFVQELGTLFSHEVDELKDIQDELNEMTLLFVENPEKEILSKITEFILCYAKTMDGLYEFKDLGYAIRHISKIFGEIDLRLIDTKKFSVFISAFCEDLTQWYHTIFIYQNARDIHYLDSSLLSSCIQMEAFFTTSSHDQYQDDLEFF